MATLRGKTTIRCGGANIFTLFLGWGQSDKFVYSCSVWRDSIFKATLPYESASCEFKSASLACGTPCGASGSDGQHVA